MQLTAVLMHADEGGFVALNPETGATTQGDTLDEAIQNLQEATGLYLEDVRSDSPRCTAGYDLRRSSKCLSYRKFLERKRFKL